MNLKEGLLDVSEKDVLLCPDQLIDQLSLVPAAFAESPVQRQLVLGSAGGIEYWSDRRIGLRFVYRKVLQVVAVLRKRWRQLVSC